MARLKKRTDGRYAATATINGKKHFFYGKTKAEAQAHRDKALKIHAVADNFDGSITVNEWAAEWLSFKRSRVTEATLASYRQVINHYILPYLGTVKLSKLSALNIRRLLDVLRDAGLSPRIQIYAYTLVKAMLTQAVKDELILKNVAISIEKPKHTKVRQMVTLSKEEIKQFMAVIPSGVHRRLFTLAFATGLRRSELLGLRWSDVNFAKGTISIQQTVLRIGNNIVISPTTKNKSSKRTLSIPASVISQLKIQRLETQKWRLKSKKWNDNDLCFPKLDGSPMYPTYLSQLCKKYATLSGFKDFTFHDIRHTHATLLIEAGVNFKVIQVRLGHSSFKETMDTYSHVTPIMEADVIEKLESIL